MGKIVALGGGEIGRAKENGGYYPVETIQIDKEIIRLSGKKQPLLLFIPTASGDSNSYYEVIKRHFGRRLKCKCDVLYLINTKFTKAEIRQKIMKADIIYVGGGNTLNMLNVWKRKGVDKILNAAYKKGIILSGLSAGAICWFKYGLSDSRPKLGKDNYGYIRIKALGFVPLLLSPHHITEKARKLALIKVMKKTRDVGVALDDCSALEIVNGNYRIVRSKGSAHAYKVYFYKKVLHYEKIINSSRFRSLKELTNANGFESSRSRTLRT